jgi:hypothetical protein
MAARFSRRHDAYHHQQLTLVLSVEAQPGPPILVIASGRLQPQKVFSVARPLCVHAAAQ